MSDLDPKTGLSTLFDAERAVRQAHDALAALGPEKLVPAARAAAELAAKLEDEEEAGLQLVRIAGLLGEFEGPDAVDGLIDILASEHPEARRAAGEELEGLAFDRFKEVALGIERALERLPVGSLALPEIPYLLLEIPEPGVVKLLKKFLQHEDPDAVAAALEVATDVADPDLAPAVEALVDDQREVELAEEEERVTIGELATECVGILEALAGGDEEEEPEPPPPASPPPRRGGRR